MKRRELIKGLAGASLLAFQSRAVAAQVKLVPPIVPDAAPAETGYRLVKNWDFTTTIRDIPTLSREFYTRYIFSNGTLDHLNDEWQRYRENDNHVFTPQGLALTARVVGGLRVSGIESGMLRSRWTGQYGVFQIRMKVPKGRGLWPAFWLGSEDQRWPPEIDVVEIINNGRETTRSSFHFLHGAGTKNETPRASRLTAQETYDPGFDYADGFHNFAIEWTRDAVRHFVDDILVCDRSYRWIHNDGSDGGFAHVLTNLAVGGKWPGPPDANALPAELTVAHIRVWQR